MTKKLIARCWEDEVYLGIICLLVGQADKAQKWLHNHFEIPWDHLKKENWQVGGKTMMVDYDGGTLTTIWLPSFSRRNNHDLTTLAHECFHVTDFTLRDAGMKLSSQTNEAYAYHMAWVLKECLSRL